MFTRNRLYASAKSILGLHSDNMLDRLLDASVRLGTSTPGADPAGDHAWAVFGTSGSVASGRTSHASAEGDAACGWTEQHSARARPRRGGGHFPLGSCGCHAWLLQQWAGSHARNCQLDQCSAAAFADGWPSLWCHCPHRSALGCSLRLVRVARAGADNPAPIRLRFYRSALTMYKASCRNADTGITHEAGIRL